MERRYLPDTDTLARYEHRVRNRLIERYHQRLASKYHYFIRFQLGDERPFYTNESLDVIISTLDNIEIINCKWTATEWNKTPWMYYLTSGKLYESYKDMNASQFTKGYSGDSIGSTEDKEWYFKYFKGKNCSYWRDRRSGKPTWHLRYGNQYANLSGDTFSVGIFSSTKETSNTPIDLVLPVLKQMNAQKWRGFYEDEITFILEQTGIERRLL
ncbi:hypothetical protein P9133_32010 [Bacillus thuringiensis]|uniref:Uncharacterized protein n=1 Tax=Bacillus thuringiensis HD-771 TaxID=1218175 RepID=A0A9W3NW75_BACTU|nr:hypothetical protein [Bacillus thuringiensis]AFQ14635.1 hypothetical protein BTG_05715 [Bacillus thuringiensis HD-771]MEC3268944.1 hypothetical protein [Bacillus thuringiensis]MEC3515438.1 hypothetical protein [Bacillus thuringiensis]MED2072295.1 hypothetical protein [Bacillus thuringiensis]MED2223630.1 hypothetical protein [Bacillus thuringiensis]